MLRATLCALAMTFSLPALAQDPGAFGATGSLGVPSSGAQEPPDRYIIQPGDTLWDISSAFMGDAYYWPRLWSFNDYITNPHWIYPGNVIVFRPGTLLEPPNLELGEQPRQGYVVEAQDFEISEPECGPDMRFEDEIPTTTYLTNTFLGRTDEVEVWGELESAKPGFLSLSEGDLVYLRLDDPGAVDCGDLVSVFRRGSAVRHPEARKLRYGNLYTVVAEARVVHVGDGGLVSAVVRNSYAEAHRGDLIGPSFPMSAEMAVSAPRGDLDGVIIARSGQDEYELAGPGETVFIDRGRADGLRVGNSFYVVHHRDEAVSHRLEDPKIPAQVVGRVVITRVNEDFSAGVLVDAARQIRVGDRVAMQIE